MEVNSDINDSAAAALDRQDNGISTGSDIPAHVMRRILSARAFRENARRIDDVTSFVLRAVKTLSEKDTLSLCPDGAGLLENISREEDHVFSKIPDDMKDVLEKRMAAISFPKKKCNNKENIEAVLSNERLRNNGYGNIVRFTIDPNVPLPFAHNRRLGSPDTSRKQSSGHYHELFFGNRDAIVFAPPENNKRKELEKIQEEKLMWLKKMNRPVKERKVLKTNVMKVPREFVPSCANVDHGSARERLQAKKSASSERSRIIFR